MLEYLKIKGSTMANAPLTLTLTITGDQVDQFKEMQALSGKGQHNNSKKSTRITL